MIVTGIYKRKGKFEIYLDHEYSFTVTDEGLYRLKLSQGMEFVPDENTNRILEEDEIIRCKNRALWMISSTPKSVKTIRNKLYEEDFSDYAIEKTVEFLKEYSFVDDEEFAKSLIRSAVRKNNSVSQIKQKLYQKGISKEEIESTIRSTRINEKEMALEVALKKYKSLYRKSEEEILRKIRYTLSYRSFSYDAVKYAMYEIEGMIKSERESEE